MIACSGCCGVESSLNISISPSRITTKSVNVPPVSTPILEVDLRDILNKFRKDRFNILNRALRIALPGEGLKIRAHGVEAMDGDLALAVVFRQTAAGDEHAMDVAGGERDAGG